MRVVLWGALAVVGVSAGVGLAPVDVDLVAANQSYRAAIASVAPAQNAVVGIGHPIVVTFTTPVTDRRVAERAIGVKTHPEMTGTFEWVEDKVVQWVPDDYWPAHSTVALSVGNIPLQFKTGPAVISVADISDHTFVVTIDGVAAGPPEQAPEPPPEQAPEPNPEVPVRVTPANDPRMPEVMVRLPAKDAAPQPPEEQEPLAIPGMTPTPDIPPGPPLPSPHHRLHWGKPGILPATMGRPEYPTPVGKYTVLAKEGSVTMDSSSVGIPVDAPDGYLIDVDHAVRFTRRGLFVHPAPWAENSIGYQNVSHGCIGLSPTDAEWYFNAVNVGDPIIVQE
ncbi:L,D-transpeptidase [Mycolicibacterium goodii]|uniref:L,D-transpeptidase n=1 Tax=Mycolicibacterium goodii TaxID=134601 RepID=UPI001BDCF850|nr:L,D-transpeptidase [Mycolicibacterium goodii]MBU8829777.1 L,D-transpeptidase [Mycolicibacterium goodii]